MSSSVNEELLEQMREKLARIEAGSGDAEARLNKVASVGEELKGVEAVAVSPDRAVTVTAGPGGSVKNIQLGEQSKRLNPQQLSALIMTTLGKALAEAARKQAAVVADTIGDTSVMDRVLKTQEQIFGVPMTADGPAPGAVFTPAPARQPEPRRAPSQRDDDGDLFRGLGGRR